MILSGCILCNQCLSISWVATSSSAALDAGVEDCGAPVAVSTYVPLVAVFISGLCIIDLSVLVRKPQDGTMNWAGWYTIVVLIVGVAVMARDIMGADFAMMGVLLFLLIPGDAVVKLEDGLSGFSNTGLLTVGGALSNLPRTACMLAGPCDGCRFNFTYLEMRSHLGGQNVL
jgi:hypothetical protein